MQCFFCNNVQNDILCWKNNVLFSDQFMRDYPHLLLFTVIKIIKDYFTLTLHLKKCLVKLILTLQILNI